MPKYDYECKKCGKVLSVRHSVSETPDFDSDCKSDKCDMEKKPTNFRIIKKEMPEGTSKPGQLVIKHIEEAKKEVKDQREEFTKEYDA